jgi:hypothetical protein
MANDQEEELSQRDYADAAKRSEEANIADESASYTNAIERDPDQAKAAAGASENVKETKMPVSDTSSTDHHPLPADGRARHDAIPESVENVRDKGDDSPDDEPGKLPEPHSYANPDGSPYRA